MASRTIFTCDECGVESEDVYAFGTIVVELEQDSPTPSEDRRRRGMKLLCVETCLPKFEEYIFDVMEEA